MSLVSEKDHLPLVDGWGCWRPFALRGAGFAIEEVLRLAAPRCVALLEEAWASEAAHLLACQSLLGAWAARASREDVATARKLAKRARRFVESSTTQKDLSHEDAATLLCKENEQADATLLKESHQERVPSLKEAGIAFLASEAKMKEGLLLFEEAYSAAQSELHDILKERIEEGRLKRAVLWQNRQAVEHGLMLIPSMGRDEQNKRARQARLLAVRYLQRYCTKNDTIGFFGPVGWGSWTEEKASFVQLGSQLMATQGVYFEPWALSVFAKQFSEAPAFLLDIPPRLHPLCALEEGRLLGVPGARGRDKSRVLTPQEYAIMRLCDGMCTARDLLEKVLDISLETGAFEKSEAARGAELFEGWEEAYGVLCALVKRGWLIWSWDLAFEAHPEKRLLEKIDNLVDPIVRSACLERISPLMDAFAHLSDVMEDSEALSAGLSRLEQVFEAQSGEAATRHPGATYAGRTLVYSDGRRDLELGLSQNLLEKIAEPLGLLLQSARWYTWKIAEAYQTHLRGLFEQMVVLEADGTVPLVRLWQAASDWLDPFLPTAVEEIVKDLQSRWSSILGLEQQSSERVVFRDCGAIKEAVMEAFAAPHPGWPCARHHAPDLMFAAPSLEALEKGDGLFVLGELHAGLNPLCTLSMTTQHPHISELERLYQKDLPAQGIAPVPHVDFARSCHDSRLAREDLHLDVGAPWSSWRGPEKTLAMGSFWVRAKGAGLEAFTRDGRFVFDMIQMIERRLKLRAAVHFSYLPSLSFRPRVQLGCLVIGRASWSFGAGSLSFAHLSRPEERFLACFRWGRGLGLPRFVFARSPKETKPIYLDFHSPASVEIFCHLVRQAEDLQIGVSEMLPAPSETWLPDAQAQHYVSEVRMIAVDPEEWRPTL